MNLISLTGSGIIGYRVQLMGTIGLAGPTFEVAPDVTSFTFTSLSPDTTYQ